jgi:C4-dicarboxylate-specific signal transduction histidine kinase
VRRLLQRHEVSKKAIDLNGTIEEVVRLMRQEGLERGVEIRFTPPERSLCVAADRVQLQQVVLNLLMNAIEAMSAVPVGERLIRLRVESTENGAATITVSDSGPGVSADNLSQLFEPFYTTKEAGLGMGLSITRTIVEAHGGSVWAENNPSAGAAFHVSLPLTPC